jgi:hypothetical protein
MRIQNTSEQASPAQHGYSVELVISAERVGTAVVGIKTNQASKQAVAGVLACAVGFALLGRCGGGFAPLARVKTTPH